MLRLSPSFLPPRIIPSTLLALLLVIAVSGCAIRSRSRPVTINQTTGDPQSNAATTNNPRPSQPRVNINTAPANELESLPGIGKALAARIMAHREKYGPFRRVEHLIIVRGISDKRFRALRELITVE